MRSWLLSALAMFAAALLWSTPALAHCDGMDGPVVTAARGALETGDPNPVLIWVGAKNEAEVRRALAAAVAVRKLSPQAREMADHYFFETLVRLHRAGEGAPYTGLKPAGRDLGPAIPMADRAIASGSDRELAQFLSNEAERGVRSRFAELQAKRKFRPDDLVAGRAYVESYVSFVHYVERLHEAAAKNAVGHYEAGQAGQSNHEE
jgi:uncharacterized protein DUF6448